MIASYLLIDILGVCCAWGEAPSSIQGETVTHGAGGRVFILQHGWRSALRVIHARGNLSLTSYIYCLLSSFEMECKMPNNRSHLNHDTLARSRRCRGDELGWFLQYDSS